MSIVQGIKAAMQALSGPTEQLKKARRGMAEKLLQRERVLHAPAHPDDLKAMVARWVDGSSASIKADLLANLRPFVRDPHKTRAVPGGQLPTFSFAGVSIGSDATRTAAVTQAQLDSVLCALFGDQIKAMAYEVIDAMEVPADALPLSQRDQAAARLDEEWAEFKRQESELVAAFESAGLPVPD
jgi:hypothetical protein